MFSSKKTSLLCSFTAAAALACLPGKALAAVNPNGFIDLTNTVGDDGLFINADNLDNVSNAGTGNFSEFLSIQNNPTESGFNSNINPRPLDTSPGTEARFLNTLAVNIFGNDFVQFGLDINESDDAITLTGLQLFLSDSPTFDPTSPGTVTPFFDTGTIAESLVSATSAAGSSDIDYAFLIPFDIAGIDPATTYVTVFAAFADAAPGGFEEFGELPDLEFTQIPTPAMLPGLIGMGVAAFRKRKQQNEGIEA
ncbi:MAG: PTPA-CTERM sorting domain-containing protein [Phormidesmis sp.]